MPTPKDTPKRISEALKDEKPKRMGDTLDFYNDSMPRRAVEGLFEKADKPKPAPRMHEEADTTPPKKTFDDLEENIAIYSSKKTKEARRRTFLDEEPEPDVDRRRNNLRLEPEYEDEDVGGYARLTRFISNIDMENLPIVKMAVGAVIIIIIIIMMALVFRVNSVNARLAEANEKLAKIEDESADFERTRIENSGLREQVNELEAEVDRLTELLKNQPVATPTPEQGSTTPATTAPAQTTPGSSTEATTYTVQRGDTLSSIASKFYSNAAEYQKIMDANNLTNTNIFVGQVLRIPPK